MVELGLSLNVLVYLTGFRDLANHCIFCGEFGIVGHRSLRRNRKMIDDITLVTQTNIP
jgi:hypothetical protein